MESTFSSWTYFWIIVMLWFLVVGQAARDSMSPLVKDKEDERSLQSRKGSSSQFYIDSPNLSKVASGEGFPTGPGRPNRFLSGKDITAYILLIVFHC